MTKPTVFYHPNLKEELEEMTGQKFDEDGKLEIHTIIIYLTKHLDTKILSDDTNQTK